MVQAWVGHFFTPLKCTYNEYDWRVTSQKLHKKHKQHDKPHHYGGGAACPSSSNEPMPPEGWVALRMIVPMPPLKRFNRFNKLM